MDGAGVMKIQMAMDASLPPKPVHSSAIMASLVRIFNGYLGFLELINYKACPASPADRTIPSYIMVDPSFGHVP
jgi:hypothetical protein